MLPFFILLFLSPLLALVSVNAIPVASRQLNGNGTTTVQVVHEYQTYVRLFCLESFQFTIPQYCGPNDADMHDHSHSHHRCERPGGIRRGRELHRINWYSEQRHFREF